MIDLQPSEEQTIIINSINDFLSARLPVLRLNPKETQGKDEFSVWGEIAELGWFQLLLSENAGGLGLGRAEGALICRVFGRFLVSPTVLSTIVAAGLAAEAGASDILQGLTGGSHRAAFMYPSQWGEAADNPELECLVLDGSGMDLLVYYTGRKVQLRRFKSTKGPGVRLSIPCFDNSLDLECLKLKDTEVIFSEDAGGGQSSQVTLFLGAMLTGIAEATRDMSVEYAKIREQFGRPIGAFQAIKHKCANLAVRAESASALTVFSALSSDVGAHDAEDLISSSLVVAANAAIENASDSIQIHGGFGFTAECSAQNYLKRARILESLCGGSRVHEARVLSGINQ